MTACLILTHATLLHFFNRSFYLDDLEKIYALQKLGKDKNNYGPTDEVTHLIAELQASNYSHIQTSTKIQDYLLRFSYVDEMRKVIDEDIYQLSLVVEPPKNIEKKNHNQHQVANSEQRRSHFNFLTHKENRSNRYLKRPSFNLTSSQTTPDFKNNNAVDTYKVDEGKSFTDRVLTKNNKSQPETETPKRSSYLEKKKLGHKKSKSLNTRLIFEKPTIQVQKPKVNRFPQYSPDINLKRSTTCETFKAKQYNNSLRISNNSLSNTHSTHSQTSSISSVNNFPITNNSVFDLNMSITEGAVLRKTVMKNGKVKSDLISKWNKYWMTLNNISGEILLYDKFADRSLDKKSNDPSNRDFYRKQPSKQILLKSDDNSTENNSSSRNTSSENEFSSIYCNMLPWYVVDRERDFMFDLCHRSNGTLYRFKVDGESSLAKWIDSFNNIPKSLNNNNNTSSLDTDFTC